MCKRVRDSPRSVSVRSVSVRSMMGALPYSSEHGTIKGRTASGKG